MAFIVMIKGAPFKCECGCMYMENVKPPEGEPKGDYYKCQHCGAVYEKS